MPFDADTRHETLRQHAPAYMQTALANITREYPNMPYFVATGPGPYPTHREFHPAFYGCFDWHSCVEMHWVIVRLLRLFLESDPTGEARATLNDLLTEERINVEKSFFRDPNHRTFERPYGWGWLLALHHELTAWNDPDSQHWAAAVAPLADLLSENLLAWLPTLPYPQRTGVHPNTAFGLSRAYDTAHARSARGDDRLLTAIHSTADRFFRQDTDYPANYEPSGADFLSPALSEAELMSRVLPASEFPGWLEHFLPGIATSQPAALFQPAQMPHTGDGQLAHLTGLNLSRAWAFVALAGRLPADDPRIAPLLAAAERHATSALPFVTDSDYMVEHWLAAYATLLLSA